MGYYDYYSSYPTSTYSSSSSTGLNGLVAAWGAFFIILLIVCLAGAILTIIGQWKMFKKAGFILEEFGENTIKLTGVPEMCIDLETKEMFLETLDELVSISRTAKQEITEKFIATIACKAAVKANMALTKEEVDNLMDELLTLPNPFTCPHGRPTAIKMSKYDIERKFARK